MKRRKLFILLSLMLLVFFFALKTPVVKAMISWIQADLIPDNFINGLDIAQVIRFYGCPGGENCPNPTPTPSPPSQCLTSGQSCNNSLDCCPNLICDLQNDTCRGITEADHYFTVTVVNEDFCLNTLSDQTIKLAFNNYQGLNNLHPHGPLRTGSGGFNYGFNGTNDQWWSWHLDPEETLMVLGSIEVCDAVPSYLEPNRCSFQYTYGYYCPWGGHITNLGCKSGSLPPPQCLAKGQSCLGWPNSCCPGYICDANSGTCTNSCGMCLTVNKYCTGSDLPCCTGLTCSTSTNRCAIN